MMASLWLKLRAIPGWVWPLLFAIILIVLPFVGAPYPIVRQIELTVMLALIVSGVNLSFGYAGELALGQVAMYAAGAYAAGLVSKAGQTDLLFQLLVGALAALTVGFISGVPGLRLGGWSLAMSSFFLILLVPDVLSLFKEDTGGRNGLSGIQPATIFGTPIDSEVYYVVILVVGIAWFAVMRNLITSRYGTALKVLKRSPVLASSIGISVFRTKLSAYAIGAIPAGLAGVLFANLDRFLSPEAFAFSFAMTVLASSIIGGPASVYGAIVGAFILQFGMNQSTTFEEWGLVFTGLFLLVGGVAFGGGLAGVGRSLVRRADRIAKARVGHEPPAEVDAVVEHRDGAVLEVEGVSKAFGGNQALSNVSTTAKPGQVTAIIGPNGSGKTTLLNMISGFYKTDSGVISIDGEQVQGMAADKVARAGVSRTFQTPYVPEKLTVHEAVEAGRFGRDRSTLLSSILRLPSYWRVSREDRLEADKALALVGLSQSRDEMADSLPLGNRRLLEVARSLVGSPKVLLLDEVASGLDEDEIEILADLIVKLRDAGLTVVLVEHNFRLVLRLADVIYVLAEGKVMAHGSPDEVENNPRVMEEYLGVTPDEEASEKGGVS